MAERAFEVVVIGAGAPGEVIGGRLGARIPGERLKPAFGWFVLLMGGFMVTRELFFP